MLIREPEAVEQKIHGAVGRWREEIAELRTLGDREGFRVAVEGDGKLSLFHFGLKELSRLKIMTF